MIVSIGHCHARKIVEALGRLGIEARSFFVPCIEAVSNSDSIAVDKFLSFFEDGKFKHYLWNRDYARFFDLKRELGFYPRMIILSIFPEMQHLYRHRETGFTFHLREKVLEKCPELKSWINIECQAYVADQNSYLDRYAKMLTKLRKRYPDTAFIILKRLDPLDIYGPSYSYLLNWREVAPAFRAMMPSVVDMLGNTTVVDMDRVLAEYANQSGCDLDYIMPRVRLLKTNGKYDHIGRDLDHLHEEFWDLMAKKIAGFLDSGQWPAEENPHEIDGRLKQGYSASSLEDHVVKSKLRSDVLWHKLYALRSLFTDLPQDRSSLLLDCVEHIPADYRVLMAIRYYKWFVKSDNFALLAKRMKPCIREELRDETIDYRMRYYKKLRELER